MSGLNYDDGIITITHVLKNGRTYVEEFRLEDIERFDYKRPGLMRGTLTFFGKDGRISQGIEIERRYLKIFDELVDALEADLSAIRKHPGQANPHQQWKKPSKRTSQNSLIQEKTVEVAFDGRYETNELEFLGSEEGFTNRTPRIVLDNPEFAVLDFETTGLQPSDGDRIIQIAVVITDSQGKVISDWSSYVNPGRDTGAVHIHGITTDQVASAPTFKELWGELSSLVAGRIIVAHNASFEVKFLLSELERFGGIIDPARFAWFDTMSLAGAAFPGLADKRQETLADHLGIDRTVLPGGKDHNALTDTHVAAKILGHYLERNYEQVLSSVNWPLVSSLPAPKIVSTEAARIIKEEEGELAKLLAAITSGPTEKITIPAGSEIYFTQFYSETQVYTHVLTRLGAIEAKSVTKSRCKLVVTGDREYVSGAMKKALKFNIPIVHFDYIDFVATEETR